MNIYIYIYIYIYWNMWIRHWQAWHLPTDNFVHSLELIETHVHPIPCMHNRVENFFCISSFTTEGCHFFVGRHHFKTWMAGANQAWAFVTRGHTHTQLSSQSIRTVRPYRGGSCCCTCVWGLCPRARECVNWLTSDFQFSIHGHVKFSSVQQFSDSLSKSFPQLLLTQS